MPPAAPAPRSLGRPCGQGWAPQAAASPPARGGSRRQGPRSRRRPGRGPSQRRDVKTPGSGPKMPHGPAPPQRRPLRAGSRDGSPALPGGPGAPRPAPAARAARRCRCGSPPAAAALDGRRRLRMCRQRLPARAGREPEGQRRGGPGPPPPHGGCGRRVRRGRSRNEAIARLENVGQQNRFHCNVPVCDTDPACSDEADSVSKTEAFGNLAFLLQVPVHANSPRMVMSLYTQHVS
ncbi:uncharacterized protein GJ701_008169 [Geothlypis trichas]